MRMEQVERGRFIHMPFDWAIWKVAVPTVLKLGDAIAFPYVVGHFIGPRFLQSSIARAYVERFSVRSSLLHSSGRCDDMRSCVTACMCLAV